MTSGRGDNAASRRNLAGPGRGTRFARGLGSVLLGITAGSVLFYFTGFLSFIVLYVVAEAANLDSGIYSHAYTPVALVVAVWMLGLAWSLIFVIPTAALLNLPLRLAALGCAAGTAISWAIVLLALSLD